MNSVAHQPAHRVAPLPQALTCRGISARYNRITVLSGVDLAVQAGEMLAVLGPNGAGKSSMMGAIAGIVSGGGDVIVAGQPIGGLGAHARARRGLAFVPEQRGNVFPALSVRENLEIGLNLLPAAQRNEQRAFIHDLFPILSRRGTAAAGVLSGGEQQMLAIGMALGRKPQVLMLDEPTQGLAPAVFDILEQAFAALKQNGLALLMGEQNVPFTARVADRYLILSHGHVTAEGGREDLASPEKLADAFMGLADDTTKTGGGFT